MRPSAVTAGLAAVAWVLFSSFARAQQAEPPRLRVGSKSFTEGVILGELARLRLEAAGFEAEHTEGLGGTRLVFNALVSGELDVYAEYTGTLLREVLAEQAPADLAAAREILGELGLEAGEPLGFENSYALGMLRSRAAELGVTTISDLREHSDLVVRVGNEFMQRQDGWPGLVERYGLRLDDARGIEHELAYRGLAGGAVDVMDLYTTDAKIAQYDILTLEDDLAFFPSYAALLLYRRDLADRAPGAIAALGELAGSLDGPAMIALNAAVELEGRGEAEVAAEFMGEALGLQVDVRTEGWLGRLLRHTLEHLVLVGVSLVAAIAVALPLGVIAAARPRLGQAVLGVVGVGQTIPALALLVFMIPLFGIGSGPAIVALFVYSLLPIVRNTHAGLVGIAPGLRESALALGLSGRARLLEIELPLALPSILAGIKIAAVIDVGAATLGALVGAGGYGQPILTGIRLDDTARILEGAVPAALLAIAVQAGFELLERALVPRGLRDASRPVSD